MPNYCNNSVYLKHTDPMMLQRVRDAAAKEQLFHEFIPVPDELLNTVSGFFGNPDEQAALEKQTQANFEKYGFRTWYDFCVSNWGTKWDCGEVDVKELPGKIHLSFQTAWTPPTGIYSNLMELGFDLVAYYYEPGCAFCGKVDDGGEMLYNIDGDSSWVESHIPRDIDEEFTIAECMASWEEEDEEDDDEDEELTS